MAETFKEKEAPKAAERLLPTIKREQAEVYAPLDTLARCAGHLRLASESARLGNSKAVIKADTDMRIARNVSALRLEGSTPVAERFLRLFDRV